MNIWFEYDGPFAIALRFRYNENNTTEPFELGKEADNSNIEFTNQDSVSVLSWDFNTPQGIKKLELPLLKDISNHVILTWEPLPDGGKAKIFHNGELSLQTKITNPNFTEDKLFITKKFAGSVSEFVVYKRSLTDEDIQQLYNGSYAHKPNIEYWLQPYRQYTLSSRQ